MNLTGLQESMLQGEQGPGTRLAMKIIVTLGRIYHAENLIPVSSCQVSGVSYKSIGKAGLDFLEELRDGGAHARVPTTLNPCGLDLERWLSLGFSQSFYRDQAQVLQAYRELDISLTCSCTPYLLGNCPVQGSHIAWAESSAVSYANSVLGARTNREGGPAALSAALTGYTANYGLHLDENRKPTVKVHVECEVATYWDFARLGLLLGRKLGNEIPVITGLSPRKCTPSTLRQLGASMAASGAIALYHVEDVTPEITAFPNWAIHAGEKEIHVNSLPSRPEFVKDTMVGKPVDLVFFGCPHSSMEEVESILSFLKEQQVQASVWIATASMLRAEMEKKGILTGLDSKIQVISDTCIVVCPIEELSFKRVITDSGKAFYYLSNKPGVDVALLPRKKCMEIAINGKLDEGGNT
ncbi:DUF521 domain-containing protein [Candidatus Bathyarchaeota archaeon]|nr:DUF521 domain-containing protein [Candidatus Bathyarchaeota archaeon]